MAPLICTTLAILVHHVDPADLAGHVILVDHVDHVDHVDPVDPADLVDPADHAIVVHAADISLATYTLLVYLN